MAIAIGLAEYCGSVQVVWRGDWLTVGELVLFSMMIQRMLWPLTRLGVTIDEYERAKSAARRTFALMATESEIRDRPNARVPEQVFGDLRFENLRFRYGDAGDVISGLTAQIAAGKVIGIAGTTGAGKSTLVKLLLRSTSHLVVKFTSIIMRFERCLLKI